MNYSLYVISIPT